MPKQQHAMMTESVIAMIFFICGFPFCFFMRYTYLILFIIPFRYLICNRFAVLLEKTFFVSHKLRLKLLTRTYIGNC